MRRPDPSLAAKRLEQALLPGLGVVLVFATLSLGGTPLWARAATELAVLALLAAWWVASVLRGEINFTLPALFYPLSAIFLFACLQAFARLSVYPPATRQEVWKLLAVGGFFLLLHNQLNSERKQQRFVTGLLVFAFALGVFAIVQRLSGAGQIYASIRVPGADPFGPFINRNHYAAWVVMLVPLVWMKFAQGRQRRESRFFWGLVLVTLGLSVMLSVSRAGTALFVFSLPLYWVLRRPARGSGRRILYAGALAVLLVGGLTVALDTGPFLSRWGAVGQIFRQPETVEAHRFQMWRDTLAMARDRLWLGSGLETFGILSDSYRSFPSNQRWAQTHNDYLQWLAEMGLVGTLLAIWFLVTLGRCAALRLRAAANHLERELVTGALVGCLLVLLHSLVDFPLRIPANEFLFAVLLTIVSTPANDNTTY